MIVVILLVASAAVALHQYNQVHEEKKRLEKELERLKRVRHIRLKYLGNR